MGTNTKLDIAMQITNEILGEYQNTTSNTDLLQFLFDVISSGLETQPIYVLQRLTEEISHDKQRRSYDGR